MDNEIELFFPLCVIEVYVSCVQPWVTPHLSRGRMSKQRRLLHLEPDMSQIRHYCTLCHQHGWYIPEDQSALVKRAYVHQWQCILNCGMSLGLHIEEMVWKQFYPLSLRLCDVCSRVLYCLAVSPDMVLEVRGEIQEGSLLAPCGVFYEEQSQRVNAPGG